MANTRAKGTRKANPNPTSKSQSPEPAKNGQSQTKNSEEMTNLSEHQPMTTNTDAEKPRKSRGRPKKTTTVDSNTAKEDQEPAPTKAPLTKRVRKPAPSGDEADNQPPLKRARADDTATNQVALQHDKANSSQKPVEARDPLPNRKGRNVHPAPKKKTRRSAQQVAADRAAKQKEIEDKIRELEEVKKRLAETNVAEDIEDEDMGEENPQRLSAAIRKRQYVELEDDSDAGEAFDFQEAEEMDSSESEEPVKKKAVSAGNFRPALNTNEEYSSPKRLGR
jgi:hypothetical protein